MRIFGTVAWIGFFSTASFAQSVSQDEQQNVERYFDLMSAVTHYSPVDGAGSHSGLAMQMGAGLSRARRSSEGLSAAKAYLLQGLIWPFDVGFSLGHVQDAKTHLAGGHLQANLFEGFRLPALAVRGHYSETFGQSASSLKVYGGDLVASYGFFRYFTAFASLGIAQSQATLRLGQEPVPMILWESEREETFSVSKQTTRQTLGLHMQVIPGSLVAVFEGQRLDDGKMEQIVGKIGYGL